MQSRLASLSDEKEELQVSLEMLRQEKWQLTTDLENRMETVSVCVCSVKSSLMLTGARPTWTLLHSQISALQQQIDGGEREAELQQVCCCFFSPS